MALKSSFVKVMWGILCHFLAKADAPTLKNLLAIVLMTLLSGASLACPSRSMRLHCVDLDLPSSSQRDSTQLFNPS